MPKPCYPKTCDAITEAEVNDYIAKIKEKVSESLINTTINAIKFYYESNYLPDFKIERIKRPRKSNALPKVLSVEEVDRMSDTETLNTPPLIRPVWTWPEIKRSSSFAIGRHLVG